MKKKKKISTISTIHYVRLVYRSIFLILLLIVYLRFKFGNGEELTTQMERRPVLLGITWCVFVVEMIFRFFPSKYESPGCQKQFARNYIKSGSTELDIPENHATVLVALIWIMFNGILGALYMTNVFDEGIMILICSAYSVCDMICILYFCPFQSWFMKNKCCCACRIYNWDYAMMFTPLFFVRTEYSWSLLALSIALMLRWEISFFRHPERFSEKTNEYLRCKNCTEKLCTHKKQLKTLRQQIEEYTKERINRLKK